MFCAINHDGTVLEYDGQLFGGIVLGRDCCFYCLPVLFRFFKDILDLFTGQGMSLEA